MASHSNSSSGLAAISRLVIATHNSGKVIEIAELLRPFQIDCVSAGELGLPEPEETATSFIGNAELKARAAALASGYHALADDSGLAVTALGGDPGIYSARWAGKNKDFALAMQLVEQKLKDSGTSDYSAKFVCALSLSTPEGTCQSFLGEVFGKLKFPSQGNNGFGYDPIFIPNGYDLSFGQFAPKDKDAISHRAIAFRKLIAHFS